MTHVIKRRQVHRAEVEQEDYYTLTDEQYEIYLTHDDPEDFLLSEGKYSQDHSDTIEILELGETIEIDLEEVFND